MIGLVALTMAAVYLMPRLTRAVPPALVAILDTLSTIAPYAVLMAMVGLLEPLLTLNLTDEITESRGYPDRECVALGAANVVSGVFGGMGGCAMIGQTAINLSSGGRGRVLHLSDRCKQLLKRAGVHPG